MNQTILERLIDKGVSIPNPATVFISDDVDPDRISGNGVTLYGGTKLIGERSLVADGATIGYEAPVTLENTLVGPDSKIHGGYFQGAVFAGKNVYGSGGHVRKGTILEEEANAAHTVGLKQTILFPFVTLGSLINFCDCLMAGGTSRKDHSEVGSSFIHFNYTPNQDKATPSMMGNVHQGVMLNQRPVFLGGQGGLVGPVRIGFGCISAAGSVVRTSEEQQDKMILGGGFKNMSLPWQPGVYSNPDRIFTHNVAYIGGLMALRAWYHGIRPLFISDFISAQLVKGLQDNLDICIAERTKRLAAFGEKLEHSRQLISGNAKGQGGAAMDKHTSVLKMLDRAALLFESMVSKEHEPPQAVVDAVESGIREKGRDYVAVIQGLPSEVAATGSNWLEGIQKELTDPLSLNP
ncbi:MAG: protein GlmU [Desulfobacterales bacterium]|nr:protein GlmU [Desulfobacterales bacterium]